MVLLTVALALAAAGCGGRADGAAGLRRDAEGRVVRAGEADASALKGGDCFNNGSDSVEQVQLVPCDEAHDYELFFSYSLVDGPYPGEDWIKQNWMRTCLDRFEDFVGRSFDDSSLDLSAIYPTELTWDAQQDRQVLCSVKAADGKRRQGSARGSGV